MVAFADLPTTVVPGLAADSVQAEAVIRVRAVAEFPAFEGSDTDALARVRAAMARRLWHEFYGDLVAPFEQLVLLASYRAHVSDLPELARVRARLRELLTPPGADAPGARRP